MEENTHPMESGRKRLKLDAESTSLASNGVNVATCATCVTCATCATSARQKKTISMIDTFTTVLMVAPALACLTDKIPDEILLMIFAYIPEMWPLLTMVCNRFRSVIRNSIINQCQDVRITRKLFEGEHQGKMLVWAANNFPLWIHEILDLAANTGDCTTINKLSRVEHNITDGEKCTYSIVTFDRVLLALRNNYSFQSAPLMWEKYISLIFDEYVDYGTWFSILNKDNKERFMESIIIGCRVKILEKILFDMCDMFTPYNIMRTFRMFKVNIHNIYESHRYYETVKYICYSCRFDKLINVISRSLSVHEHFMAEMLITLIAIGEVPKLKTIIESPMMISSLRVFAKTNSQNYPLFMRCLTFTLILHCALLGKFSVMLFLWQYAVNFFNKAVSEIVVLNIPFDSSDLENFLEGAVQKPLDPNANPNNLREDQPGYYDMEELTPPTIHWNCLAFLWNIYQQTGVRPQSVYIFNRVARCGTIEQMDILFDSGCYVSDVTLIEVLAKYGTVEKMIWAEHNVPDGVTINESTLTHALRIRKGKNGETLQEDQAMLRYILIDHAQTVHTRPAHRNAIRRIFDPEFCLSIGILPASEYDQLNPDMPDEEFEPDPLYTPPDLDTESSDDEAEDGEDDTTAANANDNAD